MAEQKDNFRLRLLPKDVADTLTLRKRMLASALESKKRVSEKEYPALLTRVWIHSNTSPEFCSKFMPFVNDQREKMTIAAAEKGISPQKTKGWFEPSSGFYENFPETKDALLGLSSENAPGLCAVNPGRTDDIVDVYVREAAQSIM
ncbi:MAG: hypothetical protein KGL39_01155 [Patescibacteria group bacterium]|nr:hypothetical protein [Patescibacteria group bacterium]